MTESAKDREEWLGRAVGTLEALAVFPKLALFIPPVRISCGWPRASRGKRPGYIYPAERSADGHMESFVSPEIADSAQALAVAWKLGTQALRGACGKTAETQSDEHRLFGHVLPDLSEGAAAIAASLMEGHTAPMFVEALGMLGDYPHAVFTAQDKPSQTRLLKLQHRCGWTARVSASQGRKVGTMATCPACEERGGWVFNGDLV